MNTKNHTVKVIAIALTAVMFFANPLTGKANDGSKKPSTTTESKVSITYQGTNDNSLVFKVDYENATGGKFWLIIKNDNGDVVYHQQFSDVHFSKTIYFQDTNTEINPTFVIHANNSDIVRQFQVNKIITETTVVTGL
jgi:hypothetical protein